MAHESIHELTAAYALHALDEREAAAFEAHLADCEACRRELASLAETAASLAFVPETAPPPPRLRTRVLDRATRERPRENVVPLRRRPLFQAVTATAAVAVAAAVAFGVWAASLQRRLDRERSASASQAQMAHIAASPDARRIAFGGGHGMLIIGPKGTALLVLNKLPPAPNGRTYEAWVIRSDTPVPAGTFHGNGGDMMAPLGQPVPRGAVVAITVEQDGGTKAPTQAPIMQVQA